MKFSLVIRLLVTLARVFAFYALTLGFIYAMKYKDPVVMGIAITSACAMFSLNSSQKKEIKK